jgi:hypothetical protein
MIGTCEKIRHDKNKGLYRPIPNFCPVIARIGLQNPGLVHSGPSMLGIVSDAS